MTLDAADQALAATLLPPIEAGRFDPPWVRDLANAQRVPEERVRQLLRKLARQGELFQVVHDLFYHQRRFVNWHRSRRPKRKRTRARWRPRRFATPPDGSKARDPAFGVLRPGWLYSFPPWPAPHARG